MLGAEQENETVHRGWKPLDQALTAQLLEEINPRIKPTPLNAATVRAEMTALPFYKDIRLYWFTDTASSLQTAVYVLYRPGDVHVMNWTNAVIYEVNRIAPLQLNGKSALAYVRFFFRFVRGLHGHFHVVEAADDIPWRGDVDPSLRLQAESLLLPLQPGGVDSAGRLILPATVLFKDSLVRTTISVERDGKVDLGEPEFLLDDLPLQEKETF